MHILHLITLLHQQIVEALLTYLFFKNHTQICINNMLKRKIKNCFQNSGFYKRTGKNGKNWKTFLPTP